MDPMKGSIHVANPRQNEYEDSLTGSQYSCIPREVVLERVWRIRRLGAVPGELNTLRL